MTPKERAAKAIDGYNARLSIYDQPSIAQVLANEVLTAIAEPSEAMIDAIVAVYSDYGMILCRATACDFWEAAHAAMMAEKETGE
jgi:hypothetical protein